jgi:hypothetical protein
VLASPRGENGPLLRRNGTALETARLLAHLDLVAIAATMAALLRFVAIG